MRGFRERISNTWIEREVLTFLVGRKQRVVIITQVVQFSNPPLGGEFSSKSKSSSLIALWNIELRKLTGSLSLTD